MFFACEQYVKIIPNYYYTFKALNKNSLTPKNALKSLLFSYCSIAEVPAD